MARCEPLLAFDLRAWGAALQPFRDTRPLLVSRLSLPKKRKFSTDHRGKVMKPSRSHLVYGVVKSGKPFDPQIALAG
ncbi:hypothetical protein BGP80_05930 [Pseudomonas putida]|uniref:Uncharacterized protein n=1 Tax=Pseudomonas putida TaxID=303 RepID=A0A2S3W9A8_PSEPU|nr:hypothetical protein BGP80_05930 [Pseudomonas putida]